MARLSINAVIPFHFSELSTSSIMAHGSSSADAGAGTLSTLVLSDASDGAFFPLESILLWLSTSLQTEI